MSKTLDATLHVTLVQPNSVWLDPQANLDHLSHLFVKHISNTDLIVLPEMFTSGFTRQPEPLLANASDHQPVIDWMKEQAQRYQAAITGSVACEVTVSESSAASGDAPNYVNRLLFVTPEGEVTHYDKCHLFTMAGEHERYQAGTQRCIVRYRDWRLLLTICYDLRFPVFCRNTHDYDAMLCVANWPQSRRHPWRTLLQARAIENQAYVLGVNRVGQDGNGLLYSGDSMVVGFAGESIADGAGGQEQVLTASLDKQALERARKDFPVLEDADSFQLL